MIFLVFTDKNSKIGQKLIVWSEEESFELAHYFIPLFYTVLLLTISSQFIKRVCAVCTYEC